MLILIISKKQPLNYSTAFIYFADASHWNNVRIAAADETFGQKWSGGSRNRELRNISVFFSLPIGSRIVTLLRSETWFLSHFPRDFRLFNGQSYLSLVKKKMIRESELSLLHILPRYWVFRLVCSSTPRLVPRLGIYDRAICVYINQTLIILINKCQNWSFIGSYRYTLTFNANDCLQQYCSVPVVQSTFCRQCSHTACLRQLKIPMIQRSRSTQSHCWMLMCRWLTWAYQVWFNRSLSETSICCQQYNRCDQQRWPRRLGFPFCVCHFTLDRS